MAKSLVSQLVNKEKSEMDLSKIADHIYDGQLKVSSRVGFTKKKTFSPSTVVFGHGHCARFWYLAFEGNEWEEKNTGINYANMNTGTSSHKRIQEALEAQGILEWSEEKIVSDDPPIFGYADAMVKLEDQFVLLEIKTTKNEAFEYHKNNGHASTYHIEQLLMYMKILKQKVGAIVYESKNTHEICVIPIVAKQEHIEFIDYLFDWLRKTYKAWENKELPERAYRKDSKVCKSCPIESVCDSKEQGVIKIERRKELGK
jgi:CRISPR/Cas system-associated exonuclease Cas4 (RecB family)